MADRMQLIWEYANALEMKLQSMKQEAIKATVGNELPGKLSVCEGYSTVIKRLAEGASNEEFND